MDRVSALAAALTGYVRISSAVIRADGSGLIEVTDHENSEGPSMQAPYGRARRRWDVDLLTLEPVQKACTKRVRNALARAAAALK